MRAFGRDAAGAQQGGDRGFEGGGVEGVLLGDADVAGGARRLVVCVVEVRVHGGFSWGCVRARILQRAAGNFETAVGIVITSYSIHYTKLYEAAMHKEYFSVPEPPDYVNHPFTLKLARSGRSIEVPAERTATDVLAEAGIHVEVKCSDGICGIV